MCEDEANAFSTSQPSAGTVDVSAVDNACGGDFIIIEGILYQFLVLAPDIYNRDRIYFITKIRRYFITKRFFSVLWTSKSGSATSVLWKDSESA